MNKPDWGPLQHIAGPVRIILVPGTVRSTADGQTHEVTEAQLAYLLGLRADEYICEGPGTRAKIENCIQIQPLRRKEAYVKAAEGISWLRGKGWIRGSANSAANHGKYWEPADEAALLEGFFAGKSPVELALKFQRLETAIVSRVRDLLRINWEEPSPFTLPAAERMTRLLIHWPSKLKKNGYEPKAEGLLDARIRCEEQALMTLEDTYKVRRQEILNRIETLRGEKDGIFNTDPGDPYA